MGQKVVLVMQEIFKATLATIAALVVLEAIKNPAKLVAGLTIAAAALGTIGSLLAKPKEVIVTGKVRGSDIYLSNNTEANRQGG